MVQNSLMSVYEDLLSRGQHLYEEDRYALYQFLLISNRNRYTRQASRLIKEKALNSCIANGEIIYSYSKGSLCYSARKKGDGALQEEIRQMRVTSLSPRRIKKIMNFFAQAEVDVIWNYPNPGNYKQDEGSFSVTYYPYFDLNYYSNGKGKLKGLIKKVGLKENPLLKKLLAS